MNACIFAGPTLPPRDPLRAVEAVWLPPAKHGDVYRAVDLLRPQAIGIVDGYFQWAPSVRHQEILWAIDGGVHVFGAASMGALRAAELAPFGMRGIGRIFEAYRTGRLEESPDEPFEDDDEVAVIHGPADSGYIAASEAMVNIRCTLARAEHERVILPATRVRLVAIAKGMYFPQRSYEALLEAGRSDVPSEELAALQAWLPAGRVNQKRDDAAKMLETLRSFLAAEPPPAHARFTFEHTTLWKRGFAAAHASVHDGDEQGVLAELRLKPGRWAALRGEALGAFGATAQAALDMEPSRLRQRVAERRDRPHEIDAILEAAQRAAAVRRIGDDVPPALLERQILARLRATGEYASLAERAQEKLARLGARADLPRIDDFSEVQLLQLRDWYFSQVHGGEMPDDLDAYLHQSGYSGETSFHEAIFAEYVYGQIADNGSAGGDATVRRSQHG